MDIVVYGKTEPPCPYCEAAKVWLDDHKISYEFIVLNDDTKRFAFYDEQGLEGPKRTVPQIFVDGVRVGGFNELKASDVADRAAAGNFDADF